MALQEMLVQGALCKCNFGTTPDTLKVLTQNKYYLNDHEGKSKLVATHKDIGATFEKNTFGSCKKTNNNPCNASVTEWHHYYKKVTYGSSKGHPLTKESKATCPIGGKDCITILKSGQTAEPTKQNFKNADPELLAHILPVINMSNFEKKEPYNHMIIE
ncbi:DUF4280 domain-containing protein [Flavobacterium covae]|uniref:DUF4280 domain-containing protein n=1 Tax=Flavobacterium covae TaxID=2906076 RepID=UPI0035E45F37